MVFLSLEFYLFIYHFNSDYLSFYLFIYLKKKLSHQLKMGGKKETSKVSFLISERTDEKLLD